MDIILSGKTLLMVNIPEKGFKIIYKYQPTIVVQEKKECKKEI
jgi:hypothetical protein